MKWFCGCLCAAVMLWGAWSAVRAQPPLYIGLCATLSGQEGAQGRYGRNGLQLAVLERNAAGGVNGRPVVLLIEDISSAGGSVIKTAQRLRLRGAEAIVGPVTSVASMQLLRSPELGGMVVVSPGASASALSGSRDHLFRVVPDDRAMIALLVQHAVSGRGLKRWVLVLDQKNTSFSADWQSQFGRSVRELGGEVVAEMGFSPSPVPMFRTMVPALQQAAPDAVLIVANDCNTARFCQQVRKAGLDTPLFATSWASSLQLLQLGGGSVEGLTWVQAVQCDSREAAFRTFQEHYREHFAENPPQMALHAYEAGDLLLEAIARHGVPSLAEGLAGTTSVQSPQGVFRLDAFGDAHRPLYVQTVRDGRIVSPERGQR